MEGGSESASFVVALPGLEEWADENLVRAE